MTQIFHGGHPLSLLAEGAAFDLESGWLFVADLHLGKATAMRDAGLGVPEGADAETLDRVAELAEKIGARAVVVLGDLFHAHSRQTPEVAAEFRGWREKRPNLKWCVVPGNHDRHIPLSDWMPDGEILTEGTQLGPWELRHHPPDVSTGSPVLCGHLHPGISIGPARQAKVRVPCFWLRRGVLVLPPFGAFTGLHPITREPGDSVWVIAGGRATELPS
jgi:DNA ligase-associated metallophosphoesterase